MNIKGNNATRQAESAASDVRSKVAPIGLIGKGLLYASLGFIAINVAMGDASSESASNTGAIERVASAPFGKFLMIALAVGLVGLVIWKAMQAVAGDPIEGSEASDRAKFAVKGFLYAGSAATAVSILIANWSNESSGSSSGGGSENGQQQAAAVVLDWPAGRWIVMLVGIGIIGYGGYQIYKHVVNTEYMDRIAAPDQKTTKTIEGIGRVGYAGRSLLIVGVGIFFFVAGVQHDPDEAKGLSGLLAELSGDTWGQVVLWIIAVGTFAFGIFTLIEAKFRRVY